MMMPPPLVSVLHYFQQILEADELGTGFDIYMADLPTSA